MSGRLIGIILVLCALVVGGGLYYAQVYAYYGDEVRKDAVTLDLIAAGSDAPRGLPVRDFRSIDKTSSPLGFRACFRVLNGFPMLTETYALTDEAVPLQAPRWFGCFDADEIGEALESGRALGFLGPKEVADGVDRFYAVMDDGRGFGWNQLNDKYKD